MALHQLAIAKASFAAALMRPDPISTSREAIDNFHSLVQSFIDKCSPTNVQNCKRWILDHIPQSKVRIAALGKFLAALSISFGEVSNATTKATGRVLSTKRRRLHLLYLINDLLYAAQTQALEASLSQNLQSTIESLVEQASAFKKSPRHQRKIHQLLHIWDEKHYYSSEFIDVLRERSRKAEAEGRSTTVGEPSEGDARVAGSKAPRNAPFIIPGMHGDQNTPWYDLPAANIMPHITPNTLRPINPQQIKPLKFVAGPANELISTAVKDFLEQVDQIYASGNTEDNLNYLPADVDTLGQPIVRDEITGEILDGESYYGWTKAFCEKMKRRKHGIDTTRNKDNPDRRGRSRSRSGSRSSDSWSRSRSARRHRHVGRWGKIDRSRSRSQSQESHRSSPRRHPRSDSPRISKPGSLQNNRSQSPTARTKSYESSHGQTTSHPSRGLGEAKYERPPILPNFSLPPPGFVPPVGPGGMPIPPPPPPNFQGQWPPPPPPPMPFGLQQPPPATGSYRDQQQWSMPFSQQPGTQGLSWSHQQSNDRTAQISNGRGIRSQQQSNGGAGHNNGGWNNNGNTTGRW